MFNLLCTGQTADEFVDRHGLSMADFFVLAHDHPALLPPVVQVSGTLLIFETPGARSAVYHGLPVTTPRASITEIGSERDALPVDAFCERYRIGPEQLLQLLRKRDLPKVYEHYHKLVMPLRSIRTWELGKQLEFGGAT